MVCTIEFEKEPLAGNTQRFSSIAATLLYLPTEKLGPKTNKAKQSVKDKQVDKTKMHEMQGYALSAWGNHWMEGNPNPRWYFSVSKTWIKTQDCCQNTSIQMIQNRLPTWKDCSLEKKSQFTQLWKMLATLNAFALHSTKPCNKKHGIMNYQFYYHWVNVFRMQNVPTLNGCLIIWGKWSNPLAGQQ